MKLITALLILGIMQVSAATFAQKITINQKNASIEAILEEIGKQSGYDVFVGVKTLQSSKPVTINVKNAAIEDVLKLCLEGQQLDFSIENKIIVIKQKQPSFIEKVLANFNGINVEGFVAGSDNTPLSGATITVKGGKRSTTTDGLGQFKLKDLPEDAILQISFMGYATKEVAAKSNLYTIKLELSTSKLDEVQVMAYGKTNKRLSTGNISTVTAADIAKQPVMNPLLALVGRVPGMVVTPTNGYASSPVKIEIRGRKTINSKFVSEPLYIIDGVPITTLELNSVSDYNRGSMGVVQSGMSPTGGQSPLFSLSPADIESIEVLKDGDATAIYGSRAANGVILITTKKGKPGPTSFNANVSQAITAITKHWDLLNTQQYLDLRREAFRNDGIIPTILNAPDLFKWDQNRYTDWQKELWGNLGKQTLASMTLSGGDAQTQFRVSGNYAKQTEVLTQSGSNQRATLGLNLGHSTLDRKFKVNLTTLYSYTSINTISTPGAVLVAPNAPEIYDANGDLNFSEWRYGTDKNTAAFPFAALKNPYNSNTHSITTNLLLGYNILKNLTFSTNFGYNFYLNNSKTLNTLAGQDPESNPMGLNFTGMTTNYNWSIEPQLDYEAKLFGGQLKVLLGGSVQKTGTKTSSTLGFGYTSDDFIESIALAPIKLPTESDGFYRYAAIFGRISYNWEDKYILNLNGRRDGSSRFGPGKQFGNFGSVGATWIMSQEPWIKEHLPKAISFLKLRGSYGLTGSDQVGDYKYLTQWSNTFHDTPLLPYAGTAPLVSTLAVNPDYRWQVNKKMEGALSIGFLEDRFNLEVALYNDRCGNQLTDYPTPLYSGFSTVTANWPAVVVNKGLEFSINTDLIRTSKINWSFSFNISRNTNVLKDYPNIDKSPYAAQYKIGKSINNLYLLHYTGVNPLTGKYGFEDYNGDGTISINNSVLPGTHGDDRYVELTLDPKFFGGFGSTFRYKNFNISCFFDYTKQMGLNPDYNTSYPLGFMNNQSTGIIGNYWKNPGDHVLYPKPTTLSDPTTNSQFSVSDGQYKDASFIRLNNLSVSYTFDEKVAKKIGARSFSVNMNAQNVFVISKSSGIDPTLQQLGGLPPAKIYSWGISLNF
ncbi:SusC/RagA family TonB-linked outer membrane protein [Pedobacter nutrimenti]|uniref:SusC/RagA family TonB-linked outer membrane protein n=1 Tax=Pedobacter nutrimenti TaxID=1241337 RepID=UPI00293075E0|nr:SusC/RagA family TonB-linked outer membrane protein [Pedobacter nutrimenti]